MKKPKKILVFLNPHCNYGTGRTRWATVGDEIYHRLGAFDIEEIRSPEEILFQASRAYDSGIRCFVAAGGDGTVNLLANALMNLEDSDVTLGAVGLGSSNDFHKPFNNETMIKGIPVRITFDKAKPCDVIQIDYQESQASQNTRFCLINASIGITAEANVFFNSRHRFIRILQRLSVNAAINAVALKTIFSYQDIPCRIVLGSGEALHASVTNLGVVKNPHFAGSLCYDTPVQPDDGKVAVNLGAGMSLVERIRLLMDLSNHCFVGGPKRRTWLENQLTVTSDRSYDLETDGEVVRTMGVDIQVVPKALRCC